MTLYIFFITKIFFIYIYTIYFTNNRELTKKALLSDDYNEVSDFFCWMFSKSSNLLNLLIVEKNGSKMKTTASKLELRKNDASSHVVANWRLMKEFYNCLAKMPKKVIDLTMTSISFCIANDLKYLFKK